MTTLSDSLARLSPAPLELLASRQLLRRSDTKFLARPTELAEIVDRVMHDYAVVRVGANNVASYANLYFDTPDHRSFHDHRRGRRVRQKIRIRTYADRACSFLEVKTRRNELHTDKVRLPVDFGSNALDAEMRRFLEDRCPFAHDVVPAVEIDYQRIMLVGVTTNERITIDLGVSVDHDDGLALGTVAIVEVKQPSRQLTTPVMRALRDAGLKSCSISKYVTALAACSGLRGSRFRPVLRKLERMARS